MFEFDWDGVGRHHDKLDKELAKLTAESCMTPFEVGDRVIVAIGLIGHGHTSVSYTHLTLPTICSV